MDFVDLREAPAMSPDDLARALAQPGRASLPYVDRNNPDRLLELECFRPQNHDPEKPVVIVQHGASRNGAEYCGAWVPAAERNSWPRQTATRTDKAVDPALWALVPPDVEFSELREEPQLAILPATRNPDRAPTASSANAITM